MRKKPTIHAVADAAGVSIATVSKYINAVQHFSPKVEKRICTAIEQLGYQSNPLARSMITGKSKAVGVAILDVCNPYTANLIKGANRVAVEHKYSLLLVDSEESAGKEDALLQDLSRRVDGLIVNSRMSEARMQDIMTYGKPVVFTARAAPSGSSSIGTEGYEAGYMLGELLVKQGHTNVAYLGFAPARPDRERMHGLSDCLTAHNLPLSRYEVRAPIVDEGERMCSSILMRHDRPDAVVCFNDMVAIGFMGAARKLGVVVPADVSVAGFDNISFSRYSSPALTTVDTQSERTGEEAMRLLLLQIAGDSMGTVGHRVLDANLVLRDSTSARPPSLTPPRTYTRQKRRSLS